MSEMAMMSDGETELEEGEPAVVAVAVAPGSWPY